MATHRLEATLTDKLLLIPLFAKVLGVVSLRALTYPGFALFGGTRALTPLKTIAFAGIQTFLGGLNTAQEILVRAPPTEDVYRDLAKQENFKPDTDTLSSGLKVHWIGDKSAQRVLVYFFGGGFTHPALNIHARFCFDLVQDLSKQWGFSIALCDYSLAPEAQHPTQLKQAADALDWILKQGKGPGDIFLGGDSCGGNLTMALVSHILHPRSDIAQIDLKAPLGGLVLISPWADFSTTTDSMKRYGLSDSVAPAEIERWSSHFLGSQTSDAYSEPNRADASWWKDLDKVTNGVLIWIGGGERLRDGCTEFANKLQSVYPKTQIFVQPGAAHIDMLFDSGWRFKTKAIGTQLIEDWLAKQFES